MSILYITADKIGEISGGGIVTLQESMALRQLAEEKGETCEVWGHGSGMESSAPHEGDPWDRDQDVEYSLGYYGLKPRLAHFYAGTFTTTVHRLQCHGCKVSYTAAAHDIQVSKQEHERLGIPFNYSHLTDQTLWNRYVGGYKAADLVICPSTYSKKIMEGYGCKNVVVIPHGCELPEKLTPPPKRFTVGYLGSYGPDKGIIYLLQAWKKLNYSDATLLLAGRDSTSPFVKTLVEHFGGGNIQLLGWVKDVADFYGRISLLCQPSASEGYGIEVLEVMAHGRPVVCSEGAGAADVVPLEWRVKEMCIDEMAHRINDLLHNAPEPSMIQPRAAQYTWEKIRQQYVAAWKELLG